MVGQSIKSDKRLKNKLQSITKRLLFHALHALGKMEVNELIIDLLC